MSTDCIQTAPDRADSEMGLLCEWDVARSFGLSDIVESGLRSGWSHPEDGHTWNEGFDTTLVLSVEDGYGAATLVIEGEPYVTAQQPRQDLTVFVNGHRAAFWRLTRREEYTLHIPVAPEWWISRNDRPVLSVVFHLPDSVRPIDIGDGSDGRLIGFCFRTLLARQAEAW